MSYQAKSKDGIVIINKPEGITSFNAVNRLKEQYPFIKKIGHTGSLDPMAEGVLIACINKATKLVPFLMEGEKVYKMRIKLGEETDTMDRDGKVIREYKQRDLSIEEIEAVIQRYEGEIEQEVPKFSACKYKGKPFYYWTRKGIDVKSRKRRVTIYKLSVEGFQYPYLDLLVTCSKGTYVRVLAHDIGQDLSTGGYVWRLTRLKNGPFGIENATPLDEMLNSKEGLLPFIIDMRSALPNLPEIMVDEGIKSYIQNGREIITSDIIDKIHPYKESRLFKMVSTDGVLLAIYKFTNGYKKDFPGRLKPVSILSGNTG